MKMTRKRIEIIRLEERVLFDAAAAAAVVEVADQQNNLQEQQDQQEQQLQEQQAQQQQAQSQPENVEIAGIQSDDADTVQAESADTQADVDADGVEHSELSNAVEAVSDADDLSDDESSDIVDAEALQESIDAAAADHTDAAIEALINGEDVEDSEDAIAPAEDESEIDSSISAQDDTDTLAKEAAGIAPDAENTVEVVEHHELAIISNTVADQDSLIDQLAEGTDVLVLNDNSDVLDQINEYLDGQDYKYDAIHVLSHGGNGYIVLNNTLIDMNTLADDPASFAALGEHLTADGDILLYGCNVASGEDGQAFASQLASLTGADVAASTDNIGMHNWELDYHYGVVDVTAFAADDYAYDMAAYTIGVAGEGSYKESGKIRYTTDHVDASKGIEKGMMVKVTAGDSGYTYDLVAGVYSFDYVLAHGGLNGDIISVDSTLEGKTFDINKQVLGTWNLGRNDVTLSSAAGIDVGQGKSLSVSAEDITVTGDLSAFSGSITLNASRALSFTQVASISMNNATVSLTAQEGFTKDWGTISAQGGTNTLTFNAPSNVIFLNVSSLEVSDETSLNFNANGLHVSTENFLLDGTLTLDTSTLTINADNFNLGALGHLNASTGAVEYTSTGIAQIELAPGTQNHVILNGGNYIYSNETSTLTVTTFSGAAGDPNDSSATLELAKLTGNNTTFSKEQTYVGRDTETNGTAMGLSVTYSDKSGKIYAGYYRDLILGGVFENSWNRTVDASSSIMVSGNLDASELRNLDIKGDLSIFNIVDNTNGTVHYTVYKSGTWEFAKVETESWSASKDNVSADSGDVYGQVVNNGDIIFKSDSYHFLGEVNNFSSIVSEINYGNGSDCAIVFDHFKSYSDSSVEAHFEIQFTEMTDSVNGFINYGKLTYHVNNFGFAASVEDLYITNAAGAELQISGESVNGHKVIYVFDNDAEDRTAIHLTNSGKITAGANSIVVFKDFVEGTGETASYVVNGTSHSDRLHIDGVMYFELDHVIEDGIYGSITNNSGVLNFNTANQEYLGVITTLGYAAGDGYVAKYGVTNVNAKSIFKGNFTANQYTKISVGTTYDRSSGEASDYSDYRSVMQSVSRWYQTTETKTVTAAGETKFLGNVTTSDEFNLNADSVFFVGTLTASHKFTINGNKTEFKKDVSIAASSLEGGTLFWFGSEDVTGTTFHGSVTVSSNGSLVTQLLLNSKASIAGTLTNSGNVTVTHDGVVFNTINNSGSGVFNLNSAANVFNGSISNSGNFYLNAVNSGINAFTNSGYLWINETASDVVGGRDFQTGYLVSRSSFKSLSNSGTVTIRGEVDFSGTYNNTGTTNLQWGGVRFLDTLTNSGHFNVTRDAGAVTAGSTIFVFDSEIINTGFFKIQATSETDSFPVVFNQKIDNSGTFTVATSGNTFDEIVNSGSFNLMIGNNTFDNQITNSKEFYLNHTNTFTENCNITNTGDFQVNAYNDFSNNDFFNESGTLTIKGDDVVFGNVVNSSTLTVTGANVSFATLTNNSLLTLKGENTLISTLNSYGTVDVFGSVYIDSLNLIYNGTHESSIIVESNADLYLSLINAPVDYTQSRFTLVGSGTLHADYNGPDILIVNSAFTFKSGASNVNIVYDNGEYTTFTYLGGEVWIVISTDTVLTDSETTLPRWYKVVDGATLTVKSASTTSAFWVTEGSSLVLDSSEIQAGEAWITEGGERAGMFIDKGGTVTANVADKVFASAVINNGTLTVNGFETEFSSLTNGGTFKVGKGGSVELTNLSENSGSASVYTTEAGGMLIFNISSGLVLTNGISGNLTNAGTMNLNTSGMYYAGTVSNSGKAGSEAVFNINAQSIFEGQISRNSYGTITVAETATGTVFQNTVNTSSDFIINGSVVFERAATISGEFTVNAASLFYDTVKINVSDSSVRNTVFSANAEIVFSKDVTITNSASAAAWNAIVNINEIARFNGSLTIDAQTGSTHKAQMFINGGNITFNEINILGSGAEFVVNGSNNSFLGKVYNGKTTETTNEKGEVTTTTVGGNLFVLNGVNHIGEMDNVGTAYLRINNGASGSSIGKLTNSGRVAIYAGINDAGEVVATTFAFNDTVENQKNGTFNINSEKVTFSREITNAGTFNVNAALAFSKALTNSGSFNINADNSVFYGMITNSGTVTVAQDISGVRFVGTFTNQEKGILALNGKDSVMNKVVNSGTIRVTGGLDTSESTPGNQINNLTMDTTLQTATRLDVSATGELTLVNVLDSYHGAIPSDTYYIVITTTTVMEVSVEGEKDKETYIYIDVEERQMTDEEVAQYKAGTFKPELEENQTYKVDKRTSYSDGIQAEMNVADGGVLRFSDNVSQTIYSTVSVTGDSDVMYNPNKTKFESLTYLDWTMVYSSSDISGYGRYRIMEGANVTVSNSNAGGDFRVMRGGLLTLENANVNTVINLGGQIVVNGGTYNEALLYNQCGTMVVYGGSFKEGAESAIVNTSEGTLDIAGTSLTFYAANSGEMKISGSNNNVWVANFRTLTVSGADNTVDVLNSADMAVTGNDNTINGVNRGLINVQGSANFVDFSDDISAALAVTGTASFTDQTLNGSFTANGATVNGNLTLNGTTEGAGNTFNGNVTYTGDNQNVISGTYNNMLEASSAVNNGTVTGYGNITLGTNAGTLNATGNNKAVEVTTNTGAINVSGGDVTLSGKNEASALVTVKDGGSAETQMSNVAGSRYTVDKGGTLTIGENAIAVGTFNASLTNRGTVDLVEQINNFAGGIDNNGGTVVKNAQVGNAAMQQLLSATGGTVDLAVASNIDGMTIGKDVTVNVCETDVKTTSVDNVTNNGILAIYDSKVEIKNIDNTNGTLAFHTTQTLDGNFGGTLKVGDGVTLTQSNGRLTDKYVIDAGGTLNLTATETTLAGIITNNGEITADMVNFTEAGIITNNGKITANTVNFTGTTSGAGTVDVDSAVYSDSATFLFGGTYDALTVNNDGTLSANAQVGNLTLNGTLATASGATLTLNGATEGFGTMTGGNGTVIYNGTNQTVYGGTYYNVVFNKAVNPIISDLVIKGNAVNNSGSLIEAANVTYDGTQVQQVMAADYGTLTLSGVGTSQELNTRLMEGNGDFEIDTLNLNCVLVKSSNGSRWNLDAVTVNATNSQVSDVNAARTYYLDGTNIQGTNNSANWLVFYSGSNVGETAPSMENANFNALSQYFYQTRFQQMNEHELFSRHTQMESARNINVRDMVVGDDIALNAKYDLVDFNRGWEGVAVMDEELGEVLNSADVVSDSFDEALLELLK